MFRVLEKQPILAMISLTIQNSELLSRQRMKWMSDLKNSVAVATFTCILMTILVVSDRFAIRCRIDITAPVPMSIDHVPVLYEMQQDKELTETYARQVKDAVSERFFFFEEFDDPKDKKTGQEADAAGKRPKDDYEYVPALYCGCCGSFHGDGECPLMDEGRMVYMIDDDEFFI